MAAAGATVLTVGGFAVKAAVDFESSFAGVRKTVDASEKDLDKLAKGFLNLSKRIPVNVNALNAIGEAAGQLGIKKTSILAFTETIAKLGVSSNLAGEEGAAMLARFANITKMPQGQFDRLGATIVALGNAGASTEKEIAEMGLRIAAAGSQVGMTEPQILGLANALSSVGIEAEAGGTAISTAMVTIDKAVASGGAKLDGFAKIAGTSADQFAAKWKADPTAALVAFIEGLDRVKREGGNVFTTLDKLGLGGIRVRDALLRAAGSGDLLRKSLELGERAWRENIALNKEAEQRFKTTASQLQLLKNNVEAYAIVWGAKLLPQINNAILVAGEFVRKFSEANGLEAKLRVVWEGLETLGSKLQDKIGEAISAIDWTAAWSKAQGIGEGLAARFKSINWTGVGEAIGNGIATAVSKAAGPGKKLGEAVASMARSVDWVTVGRAMGPGLAAALTTAFVTLLDPVFWAKNWDLALAVGLAVFGRGTGKLAAPIAVALKGMLSRSWDDAIVAITGAIEKWFPGIASVLLGVLSKLPALVATGLGWLVKPVTAAFDKLGSLAKFTVKVLGLQAVINAISNFVQWVVTKITELIGTLSSLGTTAGRALVQGMISGIGSLAGALWEKAKGVAQGAYNAAKSFLGIGSPSRLFMGIGEDTIAGFILGLTAKTPALEGKMKESVTRALEAARATVERYQGVLAGAFGKLGDFAKRAFEAKTQNILDNVSKKFDAQIAKWQQYADALTPAEKALADLDRAEAESARKSALLAAEDAQAKANAMEDGADKIAAQIAAEQMKQTALAAIARAGLVEQAAIERAAQVARAAEQIAALEAEKARELQNLEERRRQQGEQLATQLLELQTYLAKHPQAHDAVQKKVIALLRKYGVDYKTVGKSLGTAFARGLDAAGDAVMRAVDRLAKKVSKITATVTVRMQADGKDLPGRAHGGPVAARSPYMVGEKGPELFIPGMSGQILSAAKLASAGRASRAASADTSRPRLSAVGGRGGSITLSPQIKFDGPVFGTDMRRVAKDLADFLLQELQAIDRRHSGGRGGIFSGAPSIS